MYAIVEMAGQQFKVSKDQKVFVHRLDDAEGSEVIFDKVLLLDQNGAITIGAPTIDGASVQAKVLRHVKGDKVIVFKKKRRKGYKEKMDTVNSLLKSRSAKSLPLAERKRLLKKANLKNLKTTSLK